MFDLDTNDIAILVLVAYVSFAIGRATAGGRSDETREERRMRLAQEAETAFSSLSPSRQAEIDTLITQGKIIEAVKLIRAETDLGLRESKNIADHRARFLKNR